MRDLMKRRAEIDCHLPVIQPVKNPAPVKDRIQEHGQCTENNHGRNSNCSLVRRAFHHRLGTEYGSRPAYCASHGCHQRRFTVNFQQTSRKYSYQKSPEHYHQVSGNGRKPYFSNLLERKAEAVKHDTQTQDLLRAELDARNPCLRKLVAEAVCIEHSQNYSDNQRAERQFPDKFKISYIECGKGEQHYQKDSVKHIRTVFFELRHHNKSILSQGRANHASSVPNSNFGVQIYAKAESKRQACL